MGKIKIVSVPSVPQSRINIVLVEVGLCYLSFMQFLMKNEMLAKIEHYKRGILHLAKIKIVSVPSFPESRINIL